MKLYSEYQKNRIDYHQNTTKNTVHRSSLIAPRFNNTYTNISFLNHFLIKRNYNEVTLKLTAIDLKGNICESISILIDKPIVYSLNLEEFFQDNDNISEYLIEFFSSKNLFIPFPAVMVNNIGNDFINSVHSYNRVLNDIFEDDSVNKNHVYESSIDYLVNNDYDTFFNFATGPIQDKNNIEVLLVTEDSKIDKKNIAGDIGRLSNKNFFISNIFSNDQLSNSKTGTIKILPPYQKLFYGRILAGIINKKTRAFSANHSYYDNSSVEEYFDNSLSRKTYTYFPNSLNRISMYPIMSPSTLYVKIQAVKDSKVYKTDTFKLTSPSSKPIHIDVDNFVKENGLAGITAFEVVAETDNGKIPSRVNHQLIYGHENSKSNLNASINVSLLNQSKFNPSNKKGFSWGQLLIDKDYISKLGVCFKEATGKSDNIQIDFYDQTGLIKTIKDKLEPGKSVIVDSKEFESQNKQRNFIWYTIQSFRSDISAQSFHSNINSHNSSGDHSF